MKNSGKGSDMTGSDRTVGYRTWSDRRDSDRTVGNGTGELVTG